MKPVLECRQVNFSYHSLEGETAALIDITFSVRQGEFLAIVGPSGCGKSTLLSLICGLIEPETGQILLSGQPVGAGKTNVGYMLQKDHLLEWRSVYRNALLGLEIQKRDTEENREKVRNLLNTYGLSAFTKSPPSALSGGMRQRAALIRTLALEPDLLLLDEPFSALDYQTRLEVADDIGTIIRKSGKTAILVTHDLSEAISMADRILVLTHRPGRIRGILPVSFDFEEEDTPLNRRNSEQFTHYFNLVWKELRDDG
ncbi:MAG: ABC transporter ATP-binding protein [Lachnospiraceae bacterium]|nr:ABC transporter ATP-binding protein [Lachnospiraceae bacterium]